MVQISKANVFKLTTGVLASGLSVALFGGPRVPLTNAAILAGGVAFAALNSSGMGERSHRYTGGVLLQGAVLLAAGMLADFQSQSSYNNYNNQYRVVFDIGSFVAGSLTSAAIQIAISEAIHYIGGLQGRVTKADVPTTAVTAASAGYGSPSVAEVDSGEDGGGSSGGQLVTYGVGGSAGGTLSTFVPRMEGLEVAAPGSRIVAVEEELEEEKHLLHGNTTRRRRKFKTAEGGELNETSNEYRGWFGSSTHRTRTYQAGSENYGQVTAAGNGGGPLVEEVE